MPTITLNKTVFEKLVGKKLTLDKLKDRISMLGTDLEKIEGDKIHVEVFPNRPDMLSESGFARAFSAFIGVKTGLRNYKIKKSGEKVIIDKSLKNIRPYTACAIVKKLKFDDERIKEMIQLQEKLHVTYGRNRKKVAIGIYPYDKIRAPIKFYAKDPEKVKFRPLDYPSELTGLQILSKHPTGRDYAHLLKGYKKFPFFEDSEGNILSMPPIINSHTTGKVTEKTTEVFIECSGFDFNTLSKCLNIIVTFFADLGGEVYSMDLIYQNKKYTTPDLRPDKMKLDLNYVNKLLGLNLKKTMIKKLLERMGYSYEEDYVLVPAYRTDVLHQIDLVEDIAIAYGYENFEEEIPNVATIGEEDSFEIFKRKIAYILVGLGLIETMTYHITNKEKHNKKMMIDLKCIQLENALTKDYNILRSWVIPSLMEVLTNNKHNDYPQKIFDIGVCFKENPIKETKTEEFTRLAVATTHSTADYTEIKQYLDALMRAIDLEYEVYDTDHPSFIPGRVGRVNVKGKDVAYIGEINPVVLQNWQLEMPVACFELNLTELFRLF